MLEAVQDGVEPNNVLENTGFHLPVADHLQRINPPSKHELKILRAIDPEKVMLRGG
jgi:hypothetical protein